MPKKSNSIYTVTGIITNFKGTALGGFTVRVFQSGKPRKLLGESATNPNGTYKITFDSSKIEEEQDKPSLFIVVYKQQNNLGKSDVVRGTSNSVAIDLKVDATADPSLPPQTNPNFKLSGHITDTAGQPLPSLIVRAYIQDAQGTGSRLGEDAVTDQNGTYGIPCSLSAERPQKLYIEVYSQDGALLATSEVLDFRSDKDHAVIDVTVVPPAPSSVNTVSGIIYDGNNTPMANVSIQAYDKDLRSEQFLDEAATDAKGFYKISYDATKFVDSDYKTADIFIRVLNVDGALLGESPVYFNVSADFKLDFKIDNTPIKQLNEFDALVQKIKPLTEPQKVEIADLQESDKFKDISFLASETGEDFAKIALLPTAFTLATKTQLPPDIFYGLFRLQYPTNLNELLLTKSESIVNGITTAIRENILSAKWETQTELDSIVQTLNRLASGAVLSGSGDQSTAFTTVIGAALPNAKHQQTFVDVYLANENTPEKFWEALSQQTGFTDPKVVAGIQSVLQINLLTNNVPALTTLLYNEQKQNPALKDLRGFAVYSNADWLTRINKLVASGELKDFPDGTQGNTPGEKAVSYASTLTQLVKSLYPTDVFASQLGQDGGSVFGKTKPDLITFFANNQDYDLKNNNINKTLEKANLTGITDPQGLKKELITINLLYKLADDYSHVSTLRLDGIDSATALVNKYSPTQFIEKFAATVDPDIASAIYQNAQRTDNRSTVLAMSLRMGRDPNLPIYAINGKNNNLSNITPHTLTGSTPDAPSDYESMFGDTNCDCEDCQSVYSPSAYFVDILHLLQQYSPDDANKELITRRPDLIQILLTCKNTNTPLPYVDLVTEILENTISPQPTIPQTTNSKEELLAYPEHVNSAAYIPLAAANSSLNLPLDLPLEETRLYLDKLGMKRYELMELFLGKSSESKYNNLDIATEYLQVSQTELKIVNGTTSLPVTLGTVTDFLNDAELSYIEMLQVLECHFVNPVVSGERSIKIVSTDATDPATCKIEDLKLQSASPQSLLIKPFIRLWKKTGWNIFDLDRAFTALGIKDFSGDVNQKLIIPLSHIARLTAQYGLSVINAIELWADIDTGVYFDHSLDEQPKVPTQYETLFQNKQVTNPVDADFSDPGSLSGSLVDKSGIIMAALNLSQKDFDTLNQSPYVDGKLNLKNLSVLMRYAMLAKALKLSIDSLISAITLCGINPFRDNLHTVDTLIFMDKVAFIRSSGFSIQQLISLLTNTLPNTTQPNVTDIAKVLTDLRGGLKKIALQDPVGDTPDEQAKNKLQNQNSLIEDTLATAFKTESKVVDVLINSLVKMANDQTKPAITPFIDAAFIASIDPLFTVDSSNVVTWAFPELFDTYVLVLNTWDRITKLISKLKISNDEFIYLQSNETQLNITGIWNIPVTSGSELFLAFENLSNLIRFRNALASPTSEWFKVFDFAIINGTDAKKNFINSLAGVSSFSIDVLESLLGSSADNNAIGFLRYSFPADYLNSIILLNVINCASKLVQWGASSKTIEKLKMPVLGDEAATTARDLLKAKYDVPTWLNVITPLSNQLRVRRRDALTSYILTSPETTMADFRNNNSITNINSLYACFLIDLEMDPCMLTSRIKQAISSVQLFVDRWLMNLEGNIVLSQDFANQWETWRKRYRIWEANRKIFLYPENWIEPDLRDDKSPFFKELESKLKQNEITAEIAEDALRDYLEKLDIVSNLEMIGIYPDKLTGIVHVIGRTRNIPHQYYYTTREKLVWSAWEKVNVDIEGDHILLVVWNNRPTVFWATFNEKQEDAGGGTSISKPNSDSSMSISTTPSPKYLEMKLAWSEYKNGHWAARKISKSAMKINEIKVVDHRTDPETIYFIYDPSWYSLDCYIDGEELFIRLFISDNLTQVKRNVLGAFYFDGCHSSPVVRTPDAVIDGLRKYEIFIPKGSINNAMFIDERNKDTLALFESGIYQMSPGDAIVLLLNNTPGNYRLLPEHHEIEKAKPTVFFYNNEHNNFYVYSTGVIVRPPLDDITVLTQGTIANRRTTAPLSASNLASTTTSTRAIGSLVLPPVSAGTEVVSKLESAGTAFFPTILFGKHYVFRTFYHPYVCDLIRTLNGSGIDGLYKNVITDTDGSFKDGIQNRNAVDIFIRNGPYDPTFIVQTPYPVEQMDFDYNAMYSIYNWELFFQIPLLIATRLSQNQKFEEARKWFHYIYDPTRFSASESSGMERYWITKPFKEEIQKGILTIEEFLASASTDLDLQLTNWEDHPFDPHAVARLRVSAYMRSTVMKYIDNLIAWGDQLFRQNTLETINEATLLYVLAANILGKRLERIPARAIPEENSYSTIQDKLDSFSNAKVKIQSYFSLSDSNSENAIDSLPMYLFCIPKNDVLLGYWDTVSDRLFKIRHCMNIEGVVQQLPLFEPSINPALLVKAAAAGLDLNSILNDMNISLPNYRFQVLLQKANEFCGDVKALGSELLAALEKKDAEQLSIIRSTHELNLLAAVREIKVSQRDEANANLESLNKNKDVIQGRRDFYASRPYQNSSEASYFSATKVAARIQEGLAVENILASILHAIGDFKVGSGFTIGYTFGGSNLGKAHDALIHSSESTASFLRLEAEMANITGGYNRRQDDWRFQAQSADLELKQIDKQIAAAEFRVAIAEKELENHDLQIEQSQEVDDFLKSKYTNEELYDYMVQQISSVYFQSYQLAYEMAKKAQRCFEHELGVDNVSIIQFGYWDSLKKGLLAGEKLQYDLRRLETAYLDQNRREFELTKSISLLMLDPLALVKLRETGSCSIRLPEEIFDLDYPGHYFRRIKAVSLTLPCVIGPYTTISCTLRQLNNSIRINTIDADTAENYPRHTDDNRFVENYIPVKVIATSGGQNDSGVFELNFHDERYLPFEGAGAISEWSLELFNDKTNADFGKSLRQFDYNTISDVILHIRYTAQEDVGSFKDGAIAHLRDYFQKDQPTPAIRMFNLRQEFPTQWYRFLNPANPADGNVFEMDMSTDLFNYRDHDKTLKINVITLLARCTNDGDYTVVLTPPSPATSSTFTLKQSPELGGLHVAQTPDHVDPGIEIAPNELGVKWQLKISNPNGNSQVDPKEVEDLLMILGYEWN